MRDKTVLISAISATSLMTLFSYCLSHLVNKNFKEPVLLTFFLHKASGLKEVGTLPGWLGHYSLGICWAAFQYYMLKSDRVPAMLRSGLALGMISGAFGVVSWKFLFKRYGVPPNTDLKTFYSQLVLAHLIFSVTVLFSLKLQAFNRAVQKPTL